MIKYYTTYYLYSFFLSRREIFLPEVVLMKLSKASLSEIYAEVEEVATHLIAKNQNWQAKIRQQLQLHFTNVERGVWAV